MKVCACKGHGGPRHVAGVEGPRSRTTEGLLQGDALSKSAFPPPLPVQTSKDMRYIMAQQRGATNARAR